MKTRTPEQLRPVCTVSSGVTIAAITILIAVLAVGCNHRTTSSENGSSVSGVASTDKNSNAPAPVVSAPPPTAFPMPPVNGKSIQQMGWNLSDGTHNAFSEFKGKVLVLDFYATWCEPCRVSIPHLITLQQKYQNEVRVVGLNVGGADDVERIPAFAKEFNIQYALGLPDDDLVSLLLADSDAIPQTFVFDGNGQLVRRFVGFGEMTSSQIDFAVEAALRSSAD